MSTPDFPQLQPAPGAHPYSAAEYFRRAALELFMIPSDSPPPAIALITSPGGGVACWLCQNADEALHAVRCWYAGVQAALRETCDDDELQHADTTWIASATLEQIRDHYQGAFDHDGELYCYDVEIIPLTQMKVREVVIRNYTSGITDSAAVYQCGKAVYRAVAEVEAAHDQRKPA